MNPFVDIAVQPAYGRRECLVRWTAQADLGSGGVYVYRSINGGRWDIRNPDTPVRASTGLFLDTNLGLNWRDDRLDYRLLLESEAGAPHDSPVVGAFDKLTRSEFGIVRRIMELEMLRMGRGRNGLEVLVFKPLTSGAPCSCLDPVTRQSTQGSVCPECYGTGWLGGYASPVSTFCELRTWSGHAPADRADGAGADDPRLVRSRFLAWPPLARDDLVVHRPSDQRLVVSEVQSQYFRGLVPVILDPVVLRALPKGDIRQRLPLP